jgi:hypothetical protein
MMMSASGRCTRPLLTRTAVLLPHIGLIAAGCFSTRQHHFAPGPSMRITLQRASQVDRILLIWIQILAKDLASMPPRCSLAWVRARFGGILWCT